MLQLLAFSGFYHKLSQGQAWPYVNAGSGIQFERSCRSFSYTVFVNYCLPHSCLWSSEKCKSEPLDRRFKITSVFAAQSDYQPMSSEHGVITDVARAIAYKVACVCSYEGTATAW